ncbi:MAG: 3-dehydroquinate synthase, partial [Deltaproteobacteria bacterium]|nr:3-dehydroquinate synthase [Deltaproteobacteria bacterium]
MNILKVDLGVNSYEIKIERGLLGKAGAEIKALGFSGRVAVVTNPTVGALYAETLMDSLKGAGIDPLLIEIPDGEEFKNLSEISKVYDRLLEEKFERSFPIVALGGGVIGDMTGFVAATYLRGVPYIQIPTTLLSQVDSSVGGKTGVNHPLGKNLIGAFYQPSLVLIDPDVLKTLDDRDYKAGLAEVIKYGVIRDETFFDFLSDNIEVILDQESSSLISIIEKSCAIKAKIVSEDEREGGVRAILNMGHTFGHAIEKLSGYGTYKHGEAVSVGMVMAASLACKMGIAGAEVLERIKSLVISFGLPVEVDEI